VKTNLTAANAKARALLKKLEALAERGIDGERLAAQHKIARLKARLDFNQPDFSQPDETGLPNLFSGKFKRSGKARHIYSFRADDFEVANSVKWAIESAAKIPCVFRQGDLLAEAAPATVRQLTEISSYIAGSFHALIEKFGAIDGVSASERNVFVMGLYDGMMGETRKAGQRLPGWSPVKKVRKTKQGAVASAAGLHVHPYTVGLGLGRQIRFSVPLEQITAELAEATRKQIA